MLLLVPEKLVMYFKLQNNIVREAALQNYDFRNLNDKEFEVLVNDLLSRREGVRVDRFKTGRDSGVDGRFFTAGNAEVIIQSKHWIKSGIKSLIQKLKADEFPKVQKLSPKRYIIATSLELSRSDKKEIKATFEPYIISEGDILGKENLNDLLSEHQNIETKHYKLWLSSTHVLGTLLNAALIGRSEVKRDQIIEDTRIYVVTNNHDRALTKLEELHSVVITGEAGIGKTSLAEQLAHHYIKHGFEFCMIENDISEAENNFKKEGKQVFYYDDFLGRNYLIAIEGHKDSHVLNFMDRVGKDKTKRFILTSRSTVLKQGKRISDLLDIRKLDQKEYEITIESLSNLDKAKILYNHIWHGSLKEEYIEELYFDKRYLKIVKHPNYNPRLIAFITDPARLKDVPKNTYWKYIEETLNNPTDVWAHVFDQQIDELTRIAVCLIVFNGGNISEIELQESFLECALANRIINKINANTKYEGMLKIAIGSMLKRSLSGETKVVRLELFNPSVADFILKRFLPDSHSLKAYFTSLKTISALYNLKSVRKNGKITDKVYTSILKELVNKNINKCTLENNTSYFWMLADMAVEDPSTLSLQNVNSIIYTVSEINSLPIPELYVEEMCAVLEFSLLKEPTLLEEIVTKFISRCTEEPINNDDFIRLSNLAEKLKHLDEDPKTELLISIRKGVETHWENEINQIIADDGVLNDIMDPEEQSYAYDKLYDYLQDKLAYFDFSHLEISTLAGYVDISDIIYDNQRAASRGGGYYRGSGGSGTFSINDDAFVEDWFHRE